MPLKAQVSFYLATDSYLKMSFNSTHPFVWDSKTVQSTPLFQYEHASYCINDPLRFGFTLGAKLNKRHAIEIGIHGDGVSSKSRFRFSSYQPYVDLITSGYTGSESKSNQIRIFMNYKYYLLSKPKKTSIAIFPSVSLASRPGGKGQENVGGFGFGGQLTNDGLSYYSSSIGYTAYSNTSFQVGLGISSDLYFKEKYWLTLSLMGSYSNNYLSFDLDNFIIKNSNTGKNDNYEFGLYNWASGLYLGLSRQFQIYPWRPNRKKKES